MEREKFSEVSPLSATRPFKRGRSVGGGSYFPQILKDRGSKVQAIILTLESKLEKSEK